MKIMNIKIPIVGVVLMFVTICVSAQDFDGLSFGDSRDKVMSFHEDVDWQTLSIKPKEVDTLSYKGTFHDVDALVEFVMIQDELVAGTYHFGEEENTGNQAEFASIYPLFRKQYGEPDNLYEKKKFQRAMWHIGGVHPYLIELNGGHGLVKAHYDWNDKIEAYNKEVKKGNKRK
jgi:hypothetical protein